LERVEPTVDENRKVALVIGNAAYKASPLNNPVHDAKAMADVLKELKFDVVGGGKEKPLTDLDPAGMVRAIREFKDQTKGAYIALFYFAGHGIQINGRNFLLPVDAPKDNRDKMLSTALRLDDVLDALGNAKIKIVILDACRDNPFGSSFESPQGLAEPTFRSGMAGTLIAYATSPGGVARDGTPKSMGVYTQFLQNALRQPGLRIEDVLNATRRGVVEKTRYAQIPWETSSLISDRPIVLNRSAQSGVDSAVNAAKDSGLGGFARIVRPAFRALESFADCELCPRMKFVPAGAYLMGSPEGEPGRHPFAEGPQVRVQVARPFAVGVSEVTFENWEACVIGGGCQYLPDDRGWGRGKRPVIGVSWNEAQQYVRWLSRLTGKTYRLLTEVEWEYAARAETATARPWGDSVGVRQANCADCGNPEAGKQTTETGRFPANKYGLYDMLGNVWEWVDDCHKRDYQVGIGDRTECYNRTIRGGSFATSAKGVRSAARGYFPASRRDVNIGFRVATEVD